MPENSKFLTEPRRQIILSLVEENGTVSCDDLKLQLNVSQMTIWRDLTALDEAGMLRRIRGGAVRMETNANLEPMYVRKRILNRAKKEAIAHYAAEHFISDNDIIFLDAGTTVSVMIRYLHHANLTMISNGLAVINEAAPSVPDMTVMSCGGILRDVGQTFVGPQAIQFFQNIRANTYFLGATGIAFPEGITDPNLLEIQVKQAMAASAKRIIVLIDSSKFGVHSLSPVILLNNIDVLITDSAAPEPDLDRLRTMGIEVHAV